MMRRTALEAAALAVLALACAWIANAFAGPTRHLSWRTRQVRILPAATLPGPPPVAAPKVEVTPTVPAPAAPRNPERKIVIPPAAKADPAVEVAARFPTLTDALTADLPAEDARWLHQRGALFLDARRTSLFAQGHIAGAHCLSPWEDGVADKVERLAMFAKDLQAPVVVYCSGGDCQDSHLLAQKLWLAGFRNLRIYTGGYPDWEARGWPITKGEAP